MSTAHRNPQYDALPAPSFLLTVRTLDGETVEPRLFATREHATYAGSKWLRSVWDPAWGEFDNAEDPVKLYQDAGGEVTVTRVGVEAPPTWTGRSSDPAAKARFDRFIREQSLAVGVMLSGSDEFTGTRVALVLAAVSDVTEAGTVSWTVAARVSTPNGHGDDDLFIGSAASIDDLYLYFTDGVHVESELIENLYI